VFAKCNNQPNRQMGYVGEIQQSTSKQINNIYGNLTCNRDKPNIKLKIEDTVHIGSMSISPYWYIQCI
jgi:hypothetical protein